MITSKGEPVFAHVNMHGFRWKFMTPSWSRTRNSVMKIAERSSLKILPSLNTSCGCPDVNKRRGMDTAILRQNRSFMSITCKSFVKHSGCDEEMVSLCSLIRFLIGVWPCALTATSQSSFVLARTLGDSESMWPQWRLSTHYRPREVRNSISKNPYRLSINIFISIYIDYIDKVLQHYIFSVAVNYRYSQYKLIWKFWSIIDVDFG